MKQTFKLTLCQEIPVNHRLNNCFDVVLIKTTRKEYLRSMIKLSNLIIPVVFNIIFIMSRKRFADNVSSFSFTVPVITISGVVGNKVHLPCDIRSNDNDEVSMVFWYKEGAGEPIYR